MIQNKILLSFTALAILGLSAQGQTPDSSGNSFLNGSFRFRHVAVVNVDSNFDPSEVAASYGTITFDGSGNYTIAGTTVDNTVSGGAPQPLNVKGSYAIGSNGIGFIDNPLYPTDTNAVIWGAVSQGVFSGSSTEIGQENNELNDLFVAMRVGTAPSNSSFSNAYQTGVLDFAGGTAADVKNAMFKLVPDGKGAFGAFTANGQASNQSGTLNQQITGATYSFNSDGSATLAFPVPSGLTTANALFAGSKTLYLSSDGNFILGWTSNGYDIFFGVKALSGNVTASSDSGLYFTSALEDSAGVNGVDSFYGGTSPFGDDQGDAIVHERLNIPGLLSYDYGSDDQITLTADGTAPSDFGGYLYAFGDAGSCQNGTNQVPCAQAFVAIGSQGFYSLLIGLHSPVFSGTGTYIYPTGIVNAASYQPVTASIAPGELLTVFGTSLAPGTQFIQGGQPFPTTGVNGVTVTVNGIPAAIYYVSQTQLSFIVPYGVASNQTGLADIQVNNNGALSNIVQMYLTDAAPGVFSLVLSPPVVPLDGALSLDGLGYAAALHATGAFAGQPVTPDHPAQPNEYISVYLTGLGPVTPAVTDGALGPVPLSYADINSARNLQVLFDDFNSGSTFNPGTIQFAGLAPGLAGLYQVNVQVPGNVLLPGDDVYVEFVTDASDNLQIQIPYGDLASSSTAARPAVSLSKAEVTRALRARLGQRHSAQKRRAAGRLTPRTVRSSSN